MRTTIIALTAGFTILASTAAMAGGGNGNDARMQSAMATSDDQIICAPVTHEGMLLPKKRECHTSAGWMRIRLTTQQRIREVQLKGTLQHQ